MLTRYETFVHEGKNWDRVWAVPYEAWYVGVDPGKIVDFTAIIVLKHSRTPLDGWKVKKEARRHEQKFEERFDIMAARRLPLGTLYPRQIDYVEQDLAAVGHPCDLVIDASNDAVSDMFIDRGLECVRVVFGGGNEVNRLGFKRYGVPKSKIVNNVSVRLQANEIHFPKSLTSDGGALRDEFINFGSRVSEATGRMHYEASTGHDDLVMAIGIAMWWALEKPVRMSMHVGAHACY